jgi:hypothetical protein
VNGLAEFVSLVVGILAIVGILVRIAWSVGQLVQRFGDHVAQADKIHGDQEGRIRNLEERTRRIR